MTRTPFDQFCKTYLDAMLASRGKVEISREVPGEALSIDVYFQPSLSLVINPDPLGLLGRIALTPCLLEPFRNPPSPIEIRRCLQKLYWVHGEQVRAAEREKRSLKEAELPQLWIFSPSASDRLLSQLDFKADLDNWGLGIYCSGPILKIALVAIDQLSVTPETLWLRLMGKGKTQQQAIAETITLPGESEFRTDALRLLTHWKITIERSGIQDEADRELVMTLSEAYLQWEQETEQKGIQTGIQQGIQTGIQQGKQEERLTIVENLLKARFGELDESLVAVVEPLAALTSEEYAQWLLRLSGLSREALLAQFGEQVVEGDGSGSGERRD